MKLAQVPPDLIEPLWPMIGPLLQKAVEFSDGTVSFEGAVKDIMLKRQQLWVAGEDGEPIAAVAVTKLQQLESGVRRASITLLGGEDESLGGLLDLRKELEEWAKVEGCNQFRVYGRRGWARKLPDYDLKICVLTKEL